MRMYVIVNFGWRKVVVVVVVWFRHISSYMFALVVVICKVKASTKCIPETMFTDEGHRMLQSSSDQDGRFWAICLL